MTELGLEPTRPPERPRPRSTLEAVPQWCQRHSVALIVAVAVLAVVVSRLAALDTAPPGLYNDEASIGYNAWTIAHDGVDEHGARLPLFFEAFGEYKNPLYIYLLAPFTLVLPLSPAVERLPAALCGIAICLLLAWFGRLATGSRIVAIALLVAAATMPWLTIESRVGFEQITLVACLAAALAFSARAAVEPEQRRWLLLTGVALGLVVYAYSTGRLFVALLVGPLALAGRWWRDRRLPLVVGPVALAYAVLAYWNHAHPGALTARLDVIGINADGADVVTLAGRFLRNYATYWNPQYLLTNGDGNLRHNTGYGGMLLVTTLPFAVAGVVALLRRWREPLPRLVLWGLVTAPVPAALTYDGTPHALRSSAMEPFLLAAMGYGVAVAIAAVRALDRTDLVRWVASAVVTVVAIDAGAFLFDLYVRYPARALAWFDTGELSAIQDARQLAGGHRILLSTSLDAVYIQALFDGRPPPVSAPYPDSRAPELAELGMVEGDPGSIGLMARTGDILILAPSDPSPPGARLVTEESVTVAPDRVVVGSPAPDVRVLARLFRV